MPSTAHRSRVLVVDDAAPTRERLCAWLAEAGVEATACAAEREVIFEQVRLLEPASVVIDVPVHDPQGFALLFELRARHPHCMVIVTMNNLTDEYRRRCAAAQVRHCLDKATEFERIAELVLAEGDRP